MSVGSGRYRTTASSSGWTPLFLYALPSRTGVNSPASVPARSAAWIRSSVTLSSRIASVSSSLNDAYRTLKDPAKRAAHLLQLLGGKDSAEDKSVPDGFLPTMMMMQEEIEDARSAADQAELGRLAEVLKVQHEGLMHRLGELFGEIEPASSCTAVHGNLLLEIRKQLNAVSYVRKLRSMVS